MPENRHARLERNAVQHAEPWRHQADLALRQRPPALWLQQIALFKYSGLSKCGHINLKCHEPVLWRRERPSRVSGVDRLQAFGKLIPNHLSFDGPEPWNIILLHA